MKVLILDLDGVNNGPVVKALLAQRFPEAQISVASASEKTKGRKTTRKVKKAAKLSLGLDIEAVVAEPVSPEMVSGADKIIYENANNLRLATRRIGKEALEGKSLVELGVKSGHGVKPADMDSHLKDLAGKVSAVQL